jgi:hypothetical protein
MDAASAIELLNYPYSLADYEKALLAIDEEQILAHKRLLESHFLILNGVLKRKATNRRKLKSIERKNEKIRMKALFSTLSTDDLYQFTLQINHYRKIAKREFDKRPESERLTAISKYNANAIPCMANTDGDQWRLHGA